MTEGVEMPGYPVEALAKLEELVKLKELEELEELEKASPAKILEEVEDFIRKFDSKEMVMSATKEGTQVQVQLERMDSAIKRSWEATEQLEATLGPVLRMEDTSKTGADAEAINLVDHAARLETFCDTIERLADKIVELRQRCEL